MQAQLTKSEAIEEITRRLVDFYQPVRIYLFGSEARGEAGPVSDLDFCVVLADDAPERLFRPGVHRALWGIPTAADVVPWRQSDFEGRAKFVVTSLPAIVMREGKLIYDAGRMAA